MLFVKLTHSALIARRRNAEQRIATGSKPAIEDGPKFREGPNAHKRSEPLPTRQNANDFNPGKEAVMPGAVKRPNVHLLGHFLVRMWRRSIQIFRIVVIEPFKPMIPIERFNVFARPAAQIAVAVGVHLDFRFSWQG